MAKSWPQTYLTKFSSNQQRVMPAPFNPVEMAPVTYSEYPNLHRDVWSGEPGFNDRDTRVDIQKV